ncbi:hypothetical protein GGI12_005444, partial [Dipsacomyces acuminosporus]
VSTQVSSPPEPAPPQLSIWASKRNPLNRYFAKQAWAWTTALYIAAFAVRAQTRPFSVNARCLFRYAAATLYWLSMTQWFFGPSLFDRFFVHTGGACVLPAQIGKVKVGSTVATDTAALPMPSIALEYASLRSCRSAGGVWGGGHDVSGHCFLLLHSALFLAEESIAPLLSLPGAASSSALSSSAARRLVLYATAALVSVWVVMLYFTAKYFHGPAELASGTLLGLGYWVPLYLLQLLPFY